MPEGEAGLGGVEYLDGLDLADERFDELDDDLLAVADDESSETVAALQGEGVAAGSAAGGEERG